MKAGKVIRRIGYALTGVGLLLFVIGVILPLFGGTNLAPVDGVPLDKVFPWLVTNTFIILFDDGSSPVEKATAAGLLLIAMGICLIIIGLAAGAFGKKEPAPAPAPEPPAA